MRTTSVHLSSPRTRSDGLDRTALWLMHATVAASIVMQEAKGDFLPPQVSMSQYGVGRYGWSFTLTLTLWALASLAMAAADVLRAPPPPVVVTALLVVWSICTVLVGIIRADEDTSAPTAGGRAHMLLAGLALIVLPIAALIRVSVGPRQPPILMGAAVCSLAVISGLSLLMLVLAAFGTDITGLGAHVAWALYETISVVTDVVIVYLLCLVARTT